MNGQHNKKEGILFRHLQFFTASYCCHFTPCQYVQVQVDTGSPNEGKRFYFIVVNKPQAEQGGCYA